MKKKNKSKSIIIRFLLPMLLVMVLQGCLFCGAILLGGTVEQLDTNAMDILAERVVGRRNYLQNEMIGRWSNLETTVNSVRSAVGDTLRRTGAGYEDLVVNSELSSELLDGLTDDLISMLRKNVVTGTFLILNGKDGSTQKTGLYIRDLDPVSNPNDTSDLLFERAPAAIAKRVGVTMDTWWTPSFDFSGTGNYDYFMKPYQAAKEQPGLAYSDLAYWSPAFALSEGDRDVMTYSVPLVADDGTVYAVLGIEVTMDYLRTLLPAQEVDADKNGAYVLAMDADGDGSFDNVLTSGVAYKKMLGDSTQTNLSTEKNDGLFEVKGNAAGEADSKIYGNVQYLKLYNSNTPFSENRWAVIGVVEEAKLFGFSRHVQFIVAAATLLSITIGIVSLFIVGYYLIRPILELSKKVRSRSSEMSQRFERTHIKEIDELASAIEYLSKNVAEAASKLTQIIEIADMPIGAFELRFDSDMVFCTDHFFSILGMNDVALQNGYLKKDEFRSLLHSIDGCLEEEHAEEHTGIYKLVRTSGLTNWVSIRTVDDDERVLGVVVDVTKETLEKRKIQYERDYDLLTNLLNRRSFLEQLSALFEEPERLGVAAMVMFDLDNLKYINDTYGHDYGDEYIRFAANTLKLFIPHRALVSRISGDEFYVFIYGYQSKDEIRKIVDEVQDTLYATVLPLPDKQSQKIRASAGITWYPDDAQNYEALLKYADFAMYQIKNSSKGSIGEFSMQSYAKNSFLLQSKEDLNHLIDDRLVRYVFQPIVDAHTGEVFAYEALMRPQLPALSSPLDVLTLARSQSKLYQIEYLTLFKSLETFASFGERTRDAKLFVNSIPNQVLTQKDFERFQREFAPYLHRIVIELTESEKHNETFTAQKQVYLEQWGSCFALDDFGTGYNGEAMLLSVVPGFIKIDMSIVRGIDADPDRQSICKNLVSYSRQRQIKVIAEGVETVGELQTLIDCQVDYLQGYYLGKPEEEPMDIPADRKEEIQKANQS